MIPTTDFLKTLLGQGVTLRLDCARFSSDQLLELALAARLAGARLILVNPGRVAQAQIETLAATAGNVLTLDLLPA